VERPVVICGLGKVGWRVFEFLHSAGVPVAVADQHVDPADPRLGGARAVRGDFRQTKVLEEVGVRAARGVLIVTSDDLVNISASLVIRRMNPDCRIVVRMFNQNLIPRLGSAVRLTTALSVSALTAPLLALSALTGESLGAFRVQDVPHQVAEVVVEEGSDLVGKLLTTVSGQSKLLVLAHTPAAGPTRLLTDVAGDDALATGDRVILCGRPHDLDALLASSRGDLLPGVRWAGWVRRIGRTIHRTIGAVDLPVKLGTSALVLTVFLSTLVFRLGVGTSWADGLYETVTIIATGSELHGEGKPAWAKVFLSVLKLAGAALVAAFTAIFTNYLIRAKLGGALDVRRIPDGGHVVVCGIGNIGFRCVEELVRLGQQVVAIQRDAENPFAATVRRMGVAVIIGDATIPEVLRQARADTARAVLAVTSSELANLEIALLARELNAAQRVVVRLIDPDFAEAVRQSASIRQAMSVPALAAPAFAAALYGDTVKALVPVGEKTLAVIEVTVDAEDLGLVGRPLAAAMTEYRFLPVAVPGTSGEHRIAVGDRLTVVIALPDLERLLRREPAVKPESPAGPGP
jgi:Trk K+ transport system NAD-binding subunit